jgi:MFS family permease
MTAIATPIGGAIADRTGRRDALLVSGVLVFAAAMVTIAVSDKAVLATFVVIGIAAGMAVGPILSLPAEVLTSETRAPGMGMFYTLFYATAVAFPGTAGLVAEAFGSASVTFLLGAAALIMCLAVLRVFRSTRAVAAITLV